MTRKPAKPARKPRTVSDARFARYTAGIMTWTPLTDDEAARLAADDRAFNESLTDDMDTADLLNDLS